MAQPPQKTKIEGIYTRVRTISSVEFQQLEQQSSQLPNASSPQLLHITHEGENYLAFANVESAVAGLIHLVELEEELPNLNYVYIASEQPDSYEALLVIDMETGTYRIE